MQAYEQLQIAQQQCVLFMQYAAIFNACLPHNMPVTMAAAS
jgi:hypothetical protein